MSQVNYVQDTSVDKYGHSKDWKKVKLEEIRQYHSALIRDLGIAPVDFNMKMPFYDNYGRYVVGIFSSEFLREKGFFFELVTRDLTPLDPVERKVYRVARNENFKEEYEMNEKSSFLVPIEELRVVHPQSVAISKASAVTANDKFKQSTPAPAAKPQAQPQPVFTSKPQPAVEAVDLPYSEMTIRDYMAIHTGKPVSLKSWLNDLVQGYNSKLPF